MLIVFTLERTFKMAASSSSNKCIVGLLAKFLAVVSMTDLSTLRDSFTNSSKSL